MHGMRRETYDSYSDTHRSSQSNLGPTKMADTKAIRRPGLHYSGSEPRLSAVTGRALPRNNGLLNLVSSRAIFFREDQAGPQWLFRLGSLYTRGQPLVAGVALKEGKAAQTGLKPDFGPNNIGVRMKLTVFKPLFRLPCWEP